MKACSARYSGCSWLPISESQQAAWRRRPWAWGFVGEQGRGPVDQGWGQVGVADDAAGEVARGGEERVFGADGGGQEAGEPALAQAVGGEDDAGGAGGAQQAAQDDGGVGQVFDAAAGHAGHALDEFAPGFGNDAGEVAGFLAANSVVMHHVQRVAGLGDMDARQSAEGAAGDVEILAGGFGREGHGFERLGDDGAGLDEILAGAVGEADDADRHGGGGADRAGIEADEFERAAAEVGEDAVGAGDAAEHAIGGEFGLLGAGEDFDAHLGQAGGEVADEFRAVFGVAHGRGGKDVERGGTHGAGDGGVAVQHGFGLGGGGIVELAGAGHAFG